MQAEALRAVSAAGRTRKRPVLLFEPFFVLRHTVTVVAQELGVAEIVEAATPEVAGQLLRARAFAGCIVSMDDAGQGLELIRTLRMGTTASPEAVPIAVTTAACDAEMIATLKDLRVARIVLKPFKVKLILQTITQLVA